MQVMVQYFVRYNLKVITVSYSTVGLGFTWIDAQSLVHVFGLCPYSLVDILHYSEGRRAYSSGSLDRGGERAEVDSLDLLIYCRYLRVYFFLIKSVLCEEQGGAAAAGIPCIGESGVSRAL